MSFNANQWYLQGLKKIVAGDTTVPSNVTNLSHIAPITTTSMDLGWDTATDNIGVTGYAIYTGEGTFIKNVTGTSTPITGLSPGTQYSYKVKAYDAAGNYSVAFSNTLTTYTVSKATVLSAVAVTTTSIDLSWRAEVGATSYTLWWQVTGGTYASITGLTATTYTKIGLTAGTSYEFYIQVLNPDWISANSNIVTQSTTSEAGSPII